MKKTLLSLALAAASLGAAAQDITLKVHHFWPPQAMPPTKILQPFCDKIAADSNNKMKCQVFPAMQLGGTPPQLIDQARDGVVDIAFTLPGYTAGRFPIMEVFELPFMNHDAESGSRAAWDFYTKYGTKEFPGLKPLMFAIHDEGYVHTRDRQVKTLADFKGLKMRAPTRQTNKLLASLGAAPVGMPLPAVADAVSKGTIDGFLLPWEIIPSVKLHEMV
jgi:TRAP-type C4-dicarboxylate transport system substrate-binding protein